MTFQRDNVRPGVGKEYARNIRLENLLSDHLFDLFRSLQRLKVRLY